MTLTSGTRKYSCPHSVNYSTNFQFTDFNSFRDFNSFYNIYYLSIFPSQSIREQSWPCCKVGHGQPRIIIWTTLVGSESVMPYTKFEGQRPADFGEDFWRVFTIYCHGGHYGHMTRSFEQTFVPPSHWFHMKFGFDWPSGFWGEDVRSMWTTDGRWSMPIP